MLHTVPKSGSTPGFDRIAHGFDGAIANRVRGHLKPGAACASDQLAQLVRGGAPYAASRPHGDALGSAVHKNLDRSCAHQRAAKACTHAQARGGLQKLPGQEFVDANPEAPGFGEVLVST